MRNVNALIIYFLVAASGSGLYAQHVEFVKSNFPGKLPAFTVALKQYQQGKKAFDKALKKGDDFEAAGLLLSSAHAFNQKHAPLNYMLGVCSYETYRYSDAYSYFQQALSLSSDHDSLLFYYLGNTEHALKMYDSSIVHLQYYLTHFPGNRQRDSTASKRIEESRFGNILVQNHVHTRSIRLNDMINSSYDEFLPVIGHDGTYIIFNRSEPDPAKQDKISSSIWIAELKDTLAGAPVPLPMDNLYGKDFSALSVSPDGRRLLLRARDRQGRFDIYESVLSSLTTG